MQLFAFGVNHQTAPLAVRERIAFNTDVLPVALRDLVDHEPVREAAIISTCNRTEVYCSTPEPSKAIRWLASYHKLKEAVLESCIYTLPRERAVQHAFRVASGLDSMVLGEAQILGQMKQAVRSAEAAGTLGLVLHKLFQQTFSVAKLVRSQTEIGGASVSMAAAAVRLAERIFPSIADQKVLLIGAGEMIELCATHFATQRPRTMTFTNRTFERAQELARRFEGGAQALNDLPDFIAHYDIILTSTASPLPIIGKGLMERALKARRHRPVLMIDLAVPRDVEAEVSDLADVFLYSVDDLGTIVQEGRDQRQGAVSKAEAIIDAGVTDFMQWLGTREAVPMIRALRDQAERNRRHEVERALRRLSQGEAAADVLEQLSRSLTNKLLHPPTHALHHAQESDREQLVKLLERMYLIRGRE
ncbi:MAG TPA: glutamyl-tRNA reductase [Burkholderiales bacterium]|nr:glutamyl-tRNA reductase [Burkholderiales bacterium]